MSKEFSHTTVIRPFSEDSFPYVSNEMTPDGKEGCPQGIFPVVKYPTGA